MVAATLLASDRPLPHPGGGPPGATARVAVLVVTADHELWTTLGALLGARNARQFDGIAELTAQWPRARPAVVLLDARHAHALESDAQMIFTHGGALVPIAIVDEQSHVLVAALVRRGALFDAIATPIDAGASGNVIERATEEAGARFALTGGDPGLPAPARSAAALRKSVPAAAWGGLAAAVVVLAGLGYWLLRPAAEAPRPAAAAPLAAMPLPQRTPLAQAVSAAPAEDVELRLARARAAMRDKRYLEPTADSALSEYRAVLALDPSNGEARQGLDRIAELMLGHASSSLAARDYAGALHALEAARALNPKHPGLAALDAQIGQRLKDLSATQVQAALQANAFARAAALIVQAEKTGSLSAERIAELRQDMARRESGAQLEELARLAQARISQGRLLDPAGDNAKFYLQQLRERGGVAVSEQATRLDQNYIKRLAAETRTAIDAAAWSQADLLLAELRSTPGAAPQGELLRKEADKARAQTRTADLQSLAQLVKDRIGTKRLLAPPDDSAVHHFGALTAADPRNPAIAGLREALGGALVEAARAAYAAGNAADGRAAADAAHDLGVPAATLASLQVAATATVRPSAPTLARPLHLDYPPKAAAASALRMARRAPASKAGSSTASSFIPALRQASSAST